MCGIIGYIGERSVKAVLIEGLKRLEYRGYDSSGLCIVGENKLQLVKQSGKIAELEREIADAAFSGCVGVAHTRWATHGEPNRTNAHPHVDAKMDVAIVHNGIIENYHALKSLLEKEGYSFQSQTDSEIFAVLISKFYEGDLEEATAAALNCVDGTYGLAVIHRSENRIVAARKGSPLILGIGQGEMFVASDIAAVLNYTHRVVYLNDGEIASIYKNEYSIRTVNGDAVSSKVEEIKWSVDRIEKKGYKHFMLKEIYEQPESLANTLRGRLKPHQIKLDIKIDLKAVRKIVITACGTSWHSGLIAKYLIERMNRIPVEVDYASEYRYRDPLIQEGDLVIAISQSGETADTLASIREAKSRGAQVLGIVNGVGSSIAREADTGIYLHAGPEIGVASTKAFTCQLAALILFSLYLQQEQGRPLDRSLIEELIALPQKMETVFQQAETIQHIAERFYDRSNFLYLGRGVNFPVALEGALKLKEISYIHAEGYPAAEMKHGPIALIDENMPVCFIATTSHTLDKIVSNMQEVKARKGKIITLIDSPNETIESLSDYTILVPKTRQELAPLLNVISLQFFAYFVADRKGLNPDKPRNLAKSVTVE